MPKSKEPKARVLGYEGPPLEPGEAEAMKRRWAAAEDLLAALRPLELAVAEWERSARLPVDIAPPHLSVEVTMTTADLLRAKLALAKAKGE